MSHQLLTAEKSAMSGEGGLDVPGELGISIGKDVSLTCIEDSLVRNCIFLRQFSMWYSF